MKKLKPMTVLLIVSIIIAIVEALRTNTIDGLCFLWTAPLIMLVDEWDPQEWARKKLEDMKDV